jgi:hypothetical protein
LGRGRSAGRPRYAQNNGTPSDRKIAVSAAIRSWAEQDATAAQAWVLQMPPGQDRERALQSVVSSLAETDPQAALNMLQTLPASGSSRQNYYWPIFSPLGQRQSGRSRSQRGRSAARERT